MYNIIIYFILGNAFLHCDDCILAVIYGVQSIYFCFPAQLVTLTNKVKIAILLEVKQFPFWSFFISSFIKQSNSNVQVTTGQNRSYLFHLFFYIVMQFIFCKRSQAPMRITAKTFICNHRIIYDDNYYINLILVLHPFLLKLFGILSLSDTLILRNFQLYYFFDFSVKQLIFQYLYHKCLNSNTFLQF